MPLLMVVGVDRGDVVEETEGRMRVVFHRPIPATPGDEVELVVDGRACGRWRIAGASLCGDDVRLDLERPA